MDDIERVDQFQKSWSKYKKDEILSFPVTSGKKQKRAFVGFATQLLTIQILVGVSIGKRKGLYEEVRAIDSAQKIAVDRLLLWERGGAHALFVPIQDMRKRIQAGADPYEVCSQELSSLHVAWKSNPAAAERLIRLEVDEKHSTRLGNPFVVSGGLPSLGKRK